MRLAPTTWVPRFLSPASDRAEREFSSAARSYQRPPTDAAGPQLLRNLRYFSLPPGLRLAGSPVER